MNYLEFKQKNKGFTLVETLVAITILMISIVGPMVIVSNGIKSSNYAKDQVTAFYLAQDGVEALRFIRDANRISIVTDLNPLSVPWDFLSSLNCSSGSVCKIDTDVVYNGDSSMLDGVTLQGDDDYLFINNQGMYDYKIDGTETKFKRYFTIEPGLNASEVIINMTIDWSSGLYQRQFNIKESLFYWY
jgi:prepilin-type N-terminal cleavage/methylation domain-containing protein